jgi:hypothetical protein
MKTPLLFFFLLSANLLFGNGSNTLEGLAEAYIESLTVDRNSYPEDLMNPEDTAKVPENQKSIMRLAHLTNIHRRSDYAYEINELSRFDRQDGLIYSSKPSFEIVLKSKIFNSTSRILVSFENGKYYLVEPYWKQGDFEQVEKYVFDLLLKSREAINRLDPKVRSSYRDAFRSDDVSRAELLKLVQKEQGLPVDVVAVVLNMLSSNDSE